MTQSLLADAFDHHNWATLRLIDALEPLTREQLATTVPGTYGSILDTLRHLVAADCGYLFVNSGERHPQIDDDKEEAMTLPELRAEMAANGPAWKEILANEPDPAEMLTRHRDDGSTTQASRGLRMAQALHHGTDHRSQICTALTQLGIEPPEIDLWSFGWENGTVSETEPTSPATA